MQLLQASKLYSELTTNGCRWIFAGGKTRGLVDFCPHPQWGPRFKPQLAVDEVLFQKRYTNAILGFSEKFWHVVK
jgi:hypothetical protein